MSFFEFPHTRSYDSDLGWLIKRVNSYDETIQALDEWAEKTDISVKDLEAFKTAFESGNLPEGVEKALYDWASIHLVDIIGAAIKMVFFGITDDGYFIAYIPDSWKDVTFYTTELDIFLPIEPEYGHLVLAY